MKSILFPLLILTSSASAVENAKTLEKNLNGVWVLKALSCNGKAQPLAMKYKMTFHGKNGAYISKLGKCTQTELESYTYLSADTVAIKHGNRLCKPNPCDADLPAAECGKETNPKLPLFKVAFSNRGKAMTLSTSDPNSIDCTAPGQQKPAVFEFSR